MNKPDIREPVCIEVSVRAMLTLAMFVNALCTGAYRQFIHGFFQSCAP